MTFGFLATVVYPDGFAFPHIVEGVADDRAGGAEESLDFLFRAFNRVNGDLRIELIARLPFRSLSVGDAVVLRPMGGRDNASLSDPPDAMYYICASIGWLKVTAEQYANWLSWGTKARFADPRINPMMLASRREE